MAEIKLTPQQAAAVHDRGGSLLVSAAAGAGKTKVLVERLFAYMQEEHCHVDDFLIITYTKAAAAELRGKIAQELSRRVAEEPDNRHLRRQMFRVYQADIKTVDAFCAGILRENVHLLPGVDSHALTPDFRVLDEQEALLLRRHVLDRVLESFYQWAEQEDDGQALLLAETLGAGRDDRKLQALVLEVHDKIQSHPYPLRWLAQVRSDWEHLPEDLAQSAYGRVMMEDTLRKADFWAGQLEKAADNMASCQVLYRAYADRFLEVASQLRQYETTAQQGWKAMRAVQPVFRRMGTVRGEEYASDKERIRAFLDQCKKDLKEMAAVYEVSSEEYLQDLRMMAPAMLALIRLTQSFAEAYQKEKVRRNVIDFSDQEHYAITILTEENGVPTDLARQIAGRYREIMVDEYQDTNEVQNCIFRAISREERNLFAVGDVKQSIYRFRLADPTIFLEKYLHYRDAEEAKEGEARKVLLSKNFRSRKEVLDAANFVFANIMSRQMGEMDYGEEEKLHFGAAYYLPRTDTQTEFHLINVENTDEEVFDRTEVEARFVARRIRALLEEKYPVQGADGTMRPVCPEDIVILMRSPRARLKSFTHALAQENIPCCSDENEAFFTTMEIAVMFSFLQIIDNPRQDVPLISVLRSPLFGFTPDDLARIRSLRREGDFYDALQLDGEEKTADFLTVLRSLRESSRDLTVDRLIWQVYHTCHVIAVFGAMDGGEARKNNLLALAGYAEHQAAAGKVSLFDFVKHLHDLLEREKPPVLCTNQASGGVQIMSIHKSKGLEFPVVILADLHKKFNEEDLKHSVLVHPQLGLGTECVDLQRRIRYDTVSKKALAMQLRRESKAEEMRILYVAMTRAKEKLIMVDCMKHARKHVRDLISVTDCPVPPEAVSNANSLGDWLLLPLLCTAEAAPIRQWADMDTAETTPTEGGWQVKLWENPVAVTLRQEEKREDEAAASAFDPSALEAVYPYESATVIPSKVTATQLKGRVLDEEIAEGAPAMRRRMAFDRPRFLRQEQGLSAAEKGTAMHLAMQYLDLKSPLSAKEQVAHMCARHLLTPQQAHSVEDGKLDAFLRSPLAERIRQAETVYREYRFALLLPATLYTPDGDGEEMMLQGVVDCAFDTPEGLVIVDFKTDRIRPGEERQRAEHYRPQLDAYSQALSRVLQRPVAERKLYFFATGAEISLPNG